MAVVNYSKYLNYCEKSITCFTSKSSKLNYGMFVNCSTIIFYLKFTFENYAGTDKTVGGWGWDKTCGTEWG